MNVCFKFAISALCLGLQILPFVQASLSENRLYVLQNKVTYSEAVNLCKAEGKRLIKVTNEEINGIVYRFALNNKLDWYWLDGSDAKVEGQWLFDDGSKMTFFKWKPAQPDNFNNEDCVHGIIAENGLWNDIQCETKMTGICLDENGSEIPVSIKESKLVVLPSKANYQAATDMCKAKGLDLVQVTSEENNKIVLDFALKNKFEWYWLNGNDRQVEGQWVYNDGTKLFYFKWGSHQPDNSNNEDCLHGISSQQGLWNDMRCEETMHVICYGDQPEYIPESIKENKLVVLPSKVNYQAATDMCKAKGLDLVKVTSEENNKIVLDFALKNKFEWYWLNGNDRQVEGQWVYNDGTKLFFFKWGSHQPDNSNNEDCLHGISSQQGLWNDIRCEQTMHAICYDDRPETIPEVQTKMESLTIYFTDEQTTYSEAVEFCKEQNLKLISIDNAEINEELHRMMAKKRLGSFWIDGTDSKVQGQWKDSNGNLLKYKNFRNFKDDGHPDKGHCIKGTFSPMGAWNHADCSSTHNVICYQLK